MVRGTVLVPLFASKMYVKKYNILRMHQVMTSTRYVVRMILLSKYRYEGCLLILPRSPKLATLKAAYYS